MPSLPREFGGVRSAREVGWDLVAIGTARPPLNDAHVVVERDDGELLQRSGQVGVDVQPDGRIFVAVDRTPMFEFDPGLCRGGWLDAMDDACYYELKVDLGWGCVSVADAYNTGLSRLEQPERPMPRLGRRGFRDWGQAVADLRAIEGSEPPLNEAQGWKYERASGPISPEGPLTLDQADEQLLLTIGATSFARVDRSAFRGAWLRLSGDRDYLAIDVGEQNAVTVSALDQSANVS